MSKTSKRLQRFWSEITTAGFVSSAGGQAGNILFTYPALSSKVFYFHTGMHKHGAMRFSTKDIFGTPRVERFVVLDNPEAKAKFVAFLTEKFKAHNPNPSSSLRNVYTRFLHDRGMCWDGCTLHHPPIKSDEGAEEESLEEQEKGEQKIQVKNLETREEEPQGEFIIQRFYASSTNPWIDCERFGTFKTLEEARKALMEDAKIDPNGLDWAIGMNPDQDGRNWRIVERKQKAYAPFVLSS